MNGKIKVSNSIRHSWLYRLDPKIERNADTVHNAL